MDEVDYGSFNVGGGGGMHVPVTADTSDFIRAFTSITAILTSVRAALALTGAGFVSLGAVAMVESIRRAAEFETTLVKIITLTEATSMNIEEMGQRIRELAPTIGVAANDMAESLLRITSSGVYGAEAMELMEQASKASAIGMGNAAEISRIAAAAIQAFSFQNLSATDVIEIMLEGVKQGSIEADEYGNSLARVMGIAAQMGVTFEELNAFIATFSRMGAGADVATTALRSSLSAILSPGAEARKAFDSIGISIDEMRRKIREDGLTSAFLEMMQATQGNLDVIGDLLPNVRALSGVLGTAGVQASQYAEIIERVKNHQGNLDESTERFRETFEFAVNQFKSQIDVLAVGLGTVFLPTITDAIKEFNEWIAKIQEAGAQLKILTGIITGDLSVVFGSGAKGFEIGIRDNADPEVSMRDRLRQNDPNQLRELRRQVEEQQRDLGKRMQVSFNEDVNNRFNDNAKMLTAINDVLNEMGDTTIPKSVEGIRVLAGATEEQKEAIQKVIDGLQEELMLLQGRERELLINKLAAEGATAADMDRALALYDNIEALKEQIKEEKELTQEMERRAKTIAAEQERFRREGARLREQNDKAEEAKRFEDIRMQHATQLHEMEMAHERMQQMAQDMSESIVNSLLAIVEGTKSVTQAFVDMVTNILLQIARLKLEEAILGPILKALIQIPAAPGALPVPDFGGGASFVPEWMGPGTIPAPTSAQRIIVMPTINYSPSLIDARSGEQFINEHGNKIATIAVETMKNSIAIVRDMER